MNSVKKIEFIRGKAEKLAGGADEKILWSLHAMRKLRTENLRKTAVEKSLRNAVLVEDYQQHGRPLPDCLVLGFINGDPLHVVAAIDRDFDRIFIVTAYRPDPKRWEDDWKKRKR